MTIEEDRGAVVVLFGGSKRPRSRVIAWKTTSQLFTLRRRLYRKIAIQIAGTSCTSKETERERERESETRERFSCSVERLNYVTGRKQKVQRREKEREREGQRESFEGE